MEIYNRNIGTLTPSEITQELKDRGIPFVARFPIELHLRSTSPEAFKHFIGQKGMDHELIGHGYHFLAHRDSSERVAVETQLKMIGERARGILEGNPENDPKLKFVELLGYNLNWILAAPVSRKILEAHKRNEL